MKTVQKIVANPVTDGIILVLNNGTVIAHSFHVWARPSDMSPIKSEFAGEADATARLLDYQASPYEQFANEVEHPAAVTVYTKENGWLI